MLKKYKKTLKACFILSITTILLININPKSMEDKVDSKNDLNQIISDEIQDNELRENYLFFNTNSPNKMLNCSVDETFNGLKVDKVELLQNKEVVTDKVAVNMDSINNNLLVITLLEYINKFNYIRVFTNKESKVLSVGQYEFEKINNEVLIPDDDKFVINKFNIKDMLTSFEGDFEIIKNNKYDIRTQIPQKLKDLKILKQSDKLCGNNFIYNCSIDKDYFSQNNLESINFDVLFYQVDINNPDIKSKFAECFIQLEP